MKPVPVRTLAHALGSALRLVWQSAPRLAASQGVLAVVQALLPLVALVALKRAVDAATAILSARPFAAPQGMMRALLDDPTARTVALWLFVGVCAVGVQACLRELAAWIDEQDAMAVSDHVHARLHEKLLA